jgi:hypothetical protein
MVPLYTSHTLVPTPELLLPPQQQVKGGPFLAPSHDNPPPPSLDKSQPSLYPQMSCHQQAALPLAI